MSMRLSRKEKLAVISSLATMLNSGISILEAVDTLLEDNKGSSRRLLLLFREALNDGHMLSTAMEKATGVFDPVDINLIRAAEEAGTLDEALHDLTQTIKKDMAFSDKIRGSLLYPVFIMVIFFGVLIMILTFVVPRMSKVFSSLRVDLPAPTKFLIELSNFILANWIYLVVVAVVAAVLLVLFYKTQKKLLFNALSRLPLFNTLAQHIDFTRFTRSMALLLRAGVPVAEALDLSQKVVIRHDVSHAIARMKQGVNTGHPMSEGLKASHIAPSIMVHILQTAEHSGTLEKTMQELSEYFETQVARRLKAITTLIEPVLIVVIGVLVGGMMMAVIAPIYNIISQIGSR
ncbi:MAG TPA: type II secretion system F family protein [Candidatus Saccharimonadales bacterium]|nr:type II secretion system F family protein [Candidatus Saccharimonadales bacterium]